MKVIEKLGKTDGTTLVLVCSLPEKDLRMAEDLTALIEIVGGDHDPPHTYMVVAGHGFLIDLSRVAGELWNQTTSPLALNKDRLFARDGEYISSKGRR